jgi:hypothetical protein
MKYSLSIEMGFLWFSQMRKVLEEYSWEDPTFEWKESRGWLDKTFYVKGTFQQVKELADRFEGWCSEIHQLI